MENKENIENMESISKDDAEEEKEQGYQKLIGMIKSLECMTVTPSRAEIYLSTANKLSELEGYKDSEEYIRLCRQMAKQTNNELIKKIYDRAKAKKDRAKSTDDYKLAAEEFRKASGYQDADAMALECDKFSSRIERKGVSNLFLTAGGIILGILAIIFLFASPVAKYGIGNVLYKADSYNYALKFYNRTGDYKDSKQKIIKCQYMVGLDSEARGDYKAAKKAFTAAGDYKDSDIRKVKALKLVLKNSKIGSIVKVGKYNWKVLDIEENKVFLLKKAALSKRAYSSASNNVTWETSTLRQYLNKDFLEGYFSAEEQKNILQTNVKNSTNAAYGTDGGKDTLDYLFLLSIDEAQKYKSVFEGYKGTSWLRTPGGNPDSAAFIGQKGLIMDYGYTVTSNEFKAIPAMWFNID